MIDFLIESIGIAKDFISAINFLHAYPGAEKRSAVHVRWYVYPSQIQNRWCEVNEANKSFDARAIFRID